MTTPPDRESRYPDRDRNAEGRAENARPRNRFGQPLPRGSIDEMPDRVEPEAVVSGVAQALDHAIRLFDAERFFEAHEFFEYIWKSDDITPDDSDFWKGVTQVAVGCAHTQRGNDSGAVTLLRRAAGHLAPYPPRYQGIDAEALATAARGLADRVSADGASPTAEFFRFPLAPTAEARGHLDLPT